MTFPGYPSNREPIHLLRQAPVRPGDEVAGKYRVDRMLGAGAMGAVVLAWHIELEQKVAIKFLHPELAANADGAERFRREARAAVRIKNEHVARVLDVGTIETLNIPYIVMEYLHGRDLARELGVRSPLPVDEAARYLLEACEAIGEAHSRGIIHRDLKPANLFLAEHPNGGKTIKVLDFGISKLIGGSTRGMSITDTATLMGSPGYMSPEQLESSRNVDARSDIWSLGVILYEMVTGVLPFDGESVPQLIRSVIGGHRRSLAEVDPALAALEPVVESCLRQDRAERFQSVAALCAALLPFATDVTGETYRAGGGVRSAAPKRSIPPPAPDMAGAQDRGARVRSGTSPESAWGRTHGNRRASLRRGIPLAALLGIAVAFGFWLIRTPAGGSAEARPSGALEPGAATSASSALEPLPTPTPTPVPAPSAAPAAPPATPVTEPAVARTGETSAPAGSDTAPALGTSGTHGAAPPVSAKPEPVPVVSAPPVSTASAAAPRAAGEPGLQPRAAGGSAAPSRAANDNPPPVVAPAAPAEGAGRTLEAGASSGPSAPLSPYEIPEFGGRE